MRARMWRQEGVRGVGVSGAAMNGIGGCSTLLAGLPRVFSEGECWRRPGTHLRAGVGLGFLAASFGLVGCVERKETIRIAPSGAVSMDLQYTADPGDFDTPVAFPSAKSGWSIDRRSELDDKGKERVILTSHREFAPRESLPSNFSAIGDKDASLYLQFPTTVRVERRVDGTYMHFRRVYQPRSWAQIQYWNELAFDNDDVKKLRDKPLDELALKEKARVVKAFAGFELYKNMELAKRAIERMGDRIPPDASLRMGMILTSQFDDMDWEAFLAQFEADVSKLGADTSKEATDSGEAGKSEDTFTQEVKTAANEAVEDRKEREARFDAAAKKLLSESMQVAIAELRAAANLSDAQIEEFRLEFERAKKAYRISEALGAHSFQIKVIMPGELVAHNGDKIDDNDGGIIWEFGGKAFRDRSFELAATVRLAGDTNGR